MHMVSQPTVQKPYQSRFQIFTLSYFKYTKKKI
jgi:hypothetical protein